MKLFCLLPLLFLAACSTTPKLTLRPQEPPPSSSGNSAVRYPEVIRPYHFGRYVDPNDDLVMHEEHTVYRVKKIRVGICIFLPQGVNLIFHRLRQ